LLEQLRCDGALHGGCQTACQLRWKEIWLRRVAGGEPAATATPSGTSEQRSVDLGHLAQQVDESGAIRYVCQATELAAGTTPLAWGDPRQYVRDWLWGNVRLRPLLTGLAIACFNWAQRLRGGAHYPALTLPDRTTSPHETLGLQPGEVVRVK